MKRMIIAMLIGTITLTAPAIVPAEETESVSESLEITGMNGYEWGSDPEAVKAGLIEGGINEKNITIFEDGKSLFVKNCGVGGLDSDAYYYFNETGLYLGLYSITEYHASENVYLNDFDKLNESYKAVYGEPTSDKEQWIDDFYKDEPNKKGMAVCRGDLKLVTTWKAEDGAKIVHALTGDNYITKHEVYYAAPELEEPKPNTDGI